MNWEYKKKANEADVSEEQEIHREAYKIFHDKLPYTKRSKIGTRRSLSDLILFDRMKMDEVVFEDEKSKTKITVLDLVKNESKVLYDQYAQGIIDLVALSKLDNNEKKLGFKKTKENDQVIEYDIWFDITTFDDLLKSDPQFYSSNEFTVLVLEEEVKYALHLTRTMSSNHSHVYPYVPQYSNTYKLSFICPEKGITFPYKTTITRLCGPHNNQEIAYYSQEYPVAGQKKFQIVSCTERDINKTMHKNRYGIKVTIHKAAVVK